MQPIKLPTIQTPAFSTSISLRISDINYGNHLGHDALVSLTHEARVRFFKTLGFTELNVDGYGIILSNLIVNYKGEAFYGDKIKIDIAPGDPSKTRLTLYYKLTEENTQKEIAEAATTIVFFNYKTSKVVAVPNAFLEKINSFEKIKLPEPKA